VEANDIASTSGWVGAKKRMGIAFLALFYSCYLLWLESCKVILKDLFSEIYVRICVSSYFTLHLLPFRMPSYLQRYLYICRSLCHLPNERFQDRGNTSHRTGEGSLTEVFLEHLAKVASFDELRIDTVHVSGTS
jgi:hypothetical protein